jgi:hypothetical protein
LPRFEFKSRKFHWFYHVICLCGESYLLVLWCACDGCDMTGSDEDRGRSRRPGAEDRRWSSTCRILGGWMIKRSGDDVCSLHRAQGEEEREFFYLASKPRSTVFSDLASKLVATGFPV